jgi:hypothetical protein
MRGDRLTSSRRIPRALRLAPAALAVALLAGAGAPPHAGRREAPPGIEARAAKAGARAPPIALITAESGRWSLEDARNRGPAVLVFYRGSW